MLSFMIILMIFNLPVVSRLQRGVLVTPQLTHCLLVVVMEEEEEEAEELVEEGLATAEGGEEEV